MTAEQSFALRRLGCERDPSLTFDVLNISMEGPNGSGKSSIAWAASRLLQAVLLQDCAIRNVKPWPVYRITEPPDLKVDTLDSSRVDTFRTLLKSHKSEDGCISKDDLKDPLTQASLFLWARHFLEDRMLNRPPFHPLLGRRWDDGAPFSGSINIDPQYVIFRDSDKVINTDDLNQAGGLVAFKDRATGSTVVYQALLQSESTRNIVTKLIRRLYQERFLLKEDLTLVVMPENKSSLNSDPKRDLKEHDAYAGLDDFGGYRILDQFSNTFSRRLVYLRNDPTGGRGDMSVSVLAATILMKAACDLKIQNKIIPLDQEFDVDVDLLTLRHDVDDIAELHFTNDMSLILSRLITGQSPIYCGDVGILGYDKKTKRCRVIISRGYEDRHIVGRV